MRKFFSWWSSSNHVKRTAALTLIGAAMPMEQSRDPKRFSAFELSGWETNTRLQRYYEPLRHPKAPGLSLTGLRLVVADRALGLPVFRALSLCTCCRHYPGAAAERRLRSFTQPYQPSPKGLSGRPAHRPFRGLLGVHSRCGLHTRAVTKFVTR